jgi:hypothetical protein
MGNCSSGGSSHGPAELPYFDTQNNVISMTTNEKSPLNLYEARSPRSFTVSGKNLSLQMTYCAASHRGFYPDGELIIYCMPWHVPQSCPISLYAL